MRVRPMLDVRAACCGRQAEGQADAGGKGCLLREVRLSLEARAACCESEDEGEGDAGSEGCLLWEVN